MIYTSNFFNRLCSSTPNSVLIHRFKPDQCIYPPNRYLTCNNLNKYYIQMKTKKIKEINSKKIDDSFSIHVSKKALSMIDEMKKNFSWKISRNLSDEIYFDSKNWRPSNINEVKTSNDFKYSGVKCKQNKELSINYKFHKAGYHLPPIKLSPFSENSDTSIPIYLKRKTDDEFAELFDVADHNGPFRSLQRDVLALEIDSNRELWVKISDLPHGVFNCSDHCRQKQYIDDNPMLSHNPINLIQNELSVIRDLMFTAEWRQHDVFQKNAVADFSYLHPSNIHNKVEEFKNNPTPAFNEFKKIFTNMFGDCSPQLSRIIPDISKSSIYTIYENILKLDPNFEKTDIFRGSRKISQNDEIEACDMDVFRKRLAQRVPYWTEWNRINWEWLQWANSGKSQRKALNDMYRCHVTLELMCMEIKQLVMETLFSFQKVSYLYEAFERVSPAVDSKVICTYEPYVSIIEFPMKNGLKIKSYITRDKRLHPSKSIFLLIKLAQLEFYKNRKDIRQTSPLGDKIFSNALLYDNIINDTMNIKTPDSYINGRSILKSTDNNFQKMMWDFVVSDDHLFHEYQQLLIDVVERNKNDPLERYVVALDENISS